jgi:uncharacterized protein (DUF1501 family)
MFGLNRIESGAAGGVTRRQLLRIGGLACAGISLPQLLAGRETQAAQDPAAGRAKACIVIYLFGGPSQLETFDLKPSAPSDFRGEFSPIATNVPGISIGEHLPLLAQQADKYTLIRSMQHEHPRHGWGLYYMFTGRRHSRPDLDAPPTPDDHPGLGAMVSYTTRSPTGIPVAITLPRWNKFNDLPDEYAGEKAGFLGKAYDPWLIAADPAAKDFGIGGIDLPEGVTLGRLSGRNELRQRLELQMATLQETELGQRYSNLYRQAVSLITSDRARAAFELEREQSALRVRYGEHPMGQGLLLARRLIEAGTTLVTVNWHNDGSDVKSPFWDTHRDNFNSLKKRLLPPADRAISALLEDLAERGLLESTLVVVMGEFGRTPRIGRVVMNAATDASGRDHWPHAYSVLIAGGGVRGGRVHGASDERAAHVISDPVTPPDLVATILWSLGIDSQIPISDRLRRPQALCDGTPVTSLF